MDPYFEKRSIKLVHLIFQAFIETDSKLKNLNHCFQVEPPVLSKNEQKATMLRFPFVIIIDIFFYSSKV